MNRCTDKENKKLFCLLSNATLANTVLEMEAKIEWFAHFSHKTFTLVEKGKKYIQIYSGLHEL